MGLGTCDQKESNKGRAWWKHSLSLQGHSIAVVVVAAAAAAAVIIVVVVRENAEREG